MPCLSVLSAGHRIANALNVLASFLSLISIMIFLCTVGVKYRRNLISPPTEPWRLIRSDLDAYMLNLLAAEFIMAIAGVIDLKWVVEGRVYCGRVCSAEGALRVIGFTATAWFTAAIAIQTWLTIYRSQGRVYSRAVWLPFSTFVWTFMFLLTFLGWFMSREDGLPGDGSDFYRPTPFWCSINSKYRPARIAGQYLWVWICAFGSITLYVPLYMFSRGNLEFQEANGRVQWKWCFPAPSAESHDSLVDAQEKKELRSQAWKMLLYPASYTLEVLGLSIVRWVTFVTQPNGVSLEDDPTLGGYAAAHLVFGFVSRLSGFINVILILTTRPNILLFGSRGVLSPNDPRVSPGAQGTPNDIQSDVYNEGSGVNLRQFGGSSTGGLSQIDKAQIE